MPKAERPARDDDGDSSAHKRETKRRKKIDSQAAARRKEAKKDQALKAKKKKKKEAREEEEDRERTATEESGSSSEGDDEPLLKGHVPSDASVQKAATWLEEHEEVNKFSYANPKVHNSALLCIILYFLRTWPTSSPGRRWCYATQARWVRLLACVDHPHLSITTGMLVERDLDGRGYLAVVGTCDAVEDQG
jgi:hypothetical protein